MSEEIEELEQYRNAAEAQIERLAAEVRELAAQVEGLQRELRDAKELQSDADKALRAAVHFVGHIAKRMP